MCVCGVGLSDSTLPVARSLAGWRSRAAAAADLSRWHFPSRQPATTMRSPSRTHKGGLRHFQSHGSASTGQFPETVSRQRLLNLAFWFFATFPSSLFNKAKLTAPSAFLSLPCVLDSLERILFGGTDSRSENLRNGLCSRPPTPCSDRLGF